MAGFTYFVPGVEIAGLKVDRLIEAGLGHVVSDPWIASQTVKPGPSGDIGLCVSRKPMAARYEPESQRWRQIPKAEAWAGMSNGPLTPSPQDLQRNQILDGHAVKLGDGNEWIIPRALRFDDDQWQCALPRSFDMDDDGHWIMSEVESVHRDLWSGACQWFDCLADSEGETEVEFDDEMKTIIAALSANYAIGPIEIAMLGLLTSENHLEILNALVDVPGVLAIKKKQEQDG